ncbi:MAG: PAS domain S-box protein [Burkholderiales bacterium]|nr:PAS domain S-box protein [Burkholderiales bacterium]
MSVARRLHWWLSPPYSIKTVLLLALSALAVCMVVLNGAISYERISRETMASARETAESVASLVATNNTAAYVFNDLETIQFNLAQVVQLPGVDAIAVYRPGGAVLAETRKARSATSSGIGEQVPLPELPPGVSAVDGRITAQFFETWAPLNAGSEGQPGWVRVDYSMEQRSLRLDQLWRRSVNTLLVTIALIMLVLPFILNWALRPIGRLSEIAHNLSTQIGSHIAIDASSTEARAMAAALNKASHDVAEQIARTQVIVNTAAVGIISLDQLGRVISVNPATTSLFGREEGELLGQPLEQCIPDLDATSLCNLFGDFSETPGRVYRIVRTDFRGTRRDGTLFPIEITLGQAPAGGVLRFVCIVRDVTDERAAQETSELYERALASSHNGVFITNATMQSQPIIFINEAFQKITALLPHQVLGRSIDALLQGADDTASARELKRAIAQADSTSVTLQHTMDSGREIIAEVSLSPVRTADGTLTNFVGILSDVTARVHAEQAIAERSGQLDAIFSLSPDGFVLFNEDGHMIFANPAFERMTGRSWEQPGLPLTLEEFQSDLASLCHPDHSLPARGLQHDDAAPWEARLILSRPQHRVMQAQSRRNLSGRGETILYFRDVTHEDEVDRMKSEFLASAAHELRTPMVSIFGFTELLLKRQFSDERRADMLATIHRQSGLLVKMINELLDLARIESRRGLDLHIGQHPLGELVLNSVKGLMRKDNERQVSVHHIPDVPVLIDPEKMQLALSNLLSNAFKYSPQGGEVALSARVTVQNDREYAVLEVSDRGIGMTPEQLARAFERFYRADTTGNIPGTGLGLSLVKEVVELHHGHVELESEAGRGTEARLYIPMPSGTTVI